MNLLTRVAAMFHDRGYPRSVALDIRAMWPGDEQETLRIEMASFPLCDQWAIDDFYQVFDPQSPANGHVASIREYAGAPAGRIVGFCVTRIIDEHTIMLDNLAVLPEFRRLRVASRLLGDLEDRPMVRAPKHFRAVVRESNLVAQMFFRFAGWRMLRRPWQGVAEDGIKFRKWIK